jgi:hypothetical protein
MCEGIPVAPRSTRLRATSQLLRRSSRADVLHESWPEHMPATRNPWGGISSAPSSNQLNLAFRVTWRCPRDHAESLGGAFGGGSTASSQHGEGAVDA